MAGGVNLTTYIHLVPRLRMHGAVPPLLYVPGALLIDTYTVNGTINVPRFAEVLRVVRAVRLTILGRGQKSLRTTHLDDTRYV